MKVVLSRRHHGVHDEVKSTSVEGSFSDYCRYLNEPVRGRVPLVSEKKLLSRLLPSGFLPVPPREILLIVDDGDGGTAVGDPRYFRKWGKYFDAYSLTLKRGA